MSSPSSHIKILFFSLPIFPVIQHLTKIWGIPLSLHIDFQIVFVDSTKKCMSMWMNKWKNNDFKSWFFLLNLKFMLLVVRTDEQSIVTWLWSIDDIPSPFISEMPFIFAPPSFQNSSLLKAVSSANLRVRPPSWLTILSPLFHCFGINEALCFS